MDNELLVHNLEERDIRPTAMMLLILKAMLESDSALSVHELEDILVSADKSTIFRTLTLFLEKHLVHSIDDGSGSLKYAVCDNACSCDVEDLHTHFCCEECKKIFCMSSVPIPMVSLPKGFTLQSVNYVLKGLCEKCSKRRNI